MGAATPSPLGAPPHPDIAARNSGRLDVFTYP